MRLKRFFAAKETIHKMKRQPIEIYEEKMYANDMTDKELILKTCEQLTQLNIKK